MLVASFLVLGLGACGPSPSSNSPSSSGGASLAAGDYKIGFEGMQTGTFAATGMQISQGGQFAVDTINATGYLGKGVKLSMELRDSAGDPAKAIAAFNDLKRQNVSGVVCCAISAIAGALKPVAVAAKFPVVVAGAGLPGIAQAPYVNRINPLLSTPGGYDVAVKKVLKANPSVKSAALVYTKDSDGSVADAASMEKELIADGVKVKKYSVLSKDTDMSGLATQIMAEKPDMLIQSTLTPVLILLVKALRERGFTGVDFGNKGGATDSMYKLGGTDIEGMLMPVEYDQSSTDPTAKAFTQAWTAKFGTPPNVFHAEGYAGVYMLAQALKDSGDGTPEHVTDALAKIKTMNTVYGPMTVSDGQAFFAGTGLVIVKWKNGKIVPWQA
jgi:branched-chain amino acid transport system substrate-binding protein